MKKILILLLALSFLGAGCSTSPDVVNFDNNGGDKKSSNFRSIEEAKQDGRLVNEVFFYSVEVPEGLDEPLSLDYLKEANESNSLRFIETSSRQKANIEVQDPESLTLQHLKDQLKLPLVDFVNAVWKMNTEESRLNSESKELSSIEKTEFAGKTAYQFTATETFKSPRGERHFEEKTLFIFTEHKGLNYIISYPESNNVLKSLVDSLEFHK